MKFKDLPPHVCKIAEQRTIDYGNTPRDELELRDAFWWVDTPEGSIVWNAVDEGYFTYFEKFREGIHTIELTDEQVKILKIIRDYFGLHKTPFEHYAYAFLDRMLPNPNNLIELID